MSIKSLLKRENKMSNYVLKIVRDADKLNEYCDEYDVINNPKGAISIINDLKDTIKANKDLMALAAPQIGINARIFCIRFSNGEIKSFINPMITKFQGRFRMIEKDVCSDKEYMIQRPVRILVDYQTPTGKAEVDVSLENPVSAIFEQMVDILNGTLGFKYEFLGIEINDDYYAAPQEQKDELNDWYVNEYVPSKLKELNEIAEKDEDIKSTRDAIAFMTSVINGETEVVPTYNGELNFEESSLKMKEKSEAVQKSYEDALKKKYGIE